jgi:tRNA 2-thiouridine synthesizing protein E
METTIRTDELVPAAPMPPLAFDEDGFLLDAHAWTRETSRLIAEMDGIGPLGPGHWAIIFYLREHYLAKGTLPVMRHVCRVSHLEKDAVRRLFGGCREAWRTAGLPNPGEEAKTYMD